MLNKEEISRYSRHLLLPELGTTGQVKLKSAKVLVIGAGGLGCPVLLYLTAAGVGEIGIIDFDKVDESNLQRQVLYTVEDVGKLKVEVAAAKLFRQNSFVKFTTYNCKLDNQNALEIIQNFDIVIDGTDNFSTRYLVNDACIILNKPLIYGSIYRFEGQVSFLNCTDKEGTQGPSYRCLFPQPPAPESSFNCSEIGVIGVLPGIVGTLQANEAIKYITGIGKVLSGKLLLINALTMDFSTIEVVRNNETIKSAPANAKEFKKMSYDFFCGVSQNKSIKGITVRELVGLLDKREKLQIIDVREPGEQPALDELIDLKTALGDILDQADRISQSKQVIILCQSGKRSRRAIELLQNKFHLTNLYNLEEGVIGWLKDHQLTQT